jgi:hypothetical protein
VNRLILPALALLLPATSFSQDRRDLEYREVELEEDTDKTLQIGGRFESAWNEYNNVDFRPLDESSDQAILDSDDRGSFAFTGLGIDIGYQVEDNLRLVVAGSHRGLWGNDQFGNTNAFGGWIYFNAAYLDIGIGQGDARPNVRVGRQFYTIGGLGGAPDYVLADVVDMVRIDIPLGGFGNLIVIPANVFTAAADNDGANFVSFIGQSDVQTFNFRGDTLTRRHGMVLEATSLGPIEARAYGFYSDIGAAGSGSDITYDGLIGNFSDNDWVMNYGLRAQGTFGPVQPYLHFDGSAGVDRKEKVAQDVNCSGFAWGAGVTIDTTDDDDRDAGIKARVSYFDAFGPAYTDDGLLFSHGYVGMKAQQAGGLIFNRFLGFHPTSYVSRMGITDNPQDTSRKSGTRELHAAIGAEFPGAMWVRGSWWMLQDTGVSEVNFSQLDTITPPFGYARSEFAAEQRLGKTLGQELNLDLGAHAMEHLDLFLSVGVIVGPDFYSNEIARVAGSALGAKNPAMPWALAGGTRVRF